MMMDIKEIIKWFIPCFHILLVNCKLKTDFRLTFICLFLLFNFRLSVGANLNRNDVEDIENYFVDKTKNVDNNLSYGDSIKVNQSNYIDEAIEKQEIQSWDDSLGRTFGRPMKKMLLALVPLAFQIGAASTWAVVAALVGVKTLAVALLILKLLLIAGAVKVGALLSEKSHYGSHGWEPPTPTPHQKEVHVHIHNGKQEVHDAHDENLPYSSWNRDGSQDAMVTQNVKVVYDPYVAPGVGPQTISTPFGHYVRVEPSNAMPTYPPDK